MRDSRPHASTSAWTSADPASVSLYLNEGLTFLGPPPTGRHHNDALQRLAEQSDALLYALNFQHQGRTADETAVEQVRCASCSAT